MKNVLLVGLTALILSGCNQGSPTVDQSKLCIYANDEQAKECKSGELSYYKPGQWGNEQLPLNVAAVYCDFNYPIQSNNSGVMCVFTNKRMHLLN